MERDLGYGPHSERNKLDLYLPEKEPDHPLPLVIWIHGGGWEAGNKDNPMGLGMLKKGYALASINYRLSQMAKFPAQIGTAKRPYASSPTPRSTISIPITSALRTIDRGHLVALLGTTGDVKDLEGDSPNKGVSSRVQAVVDFFGPTDMLKMKEEATEKPVFDADAADSPVGRLFGGPVQEHKELAEKANPIHYITKDARLSSSCTATKTTSCRWHRAVFSTRLSRRPG